MFFIKTHINSFLDRLARKRAREEVRQDLLCEYINPKTNKICCAYKTDDSRFCHCHKRKNPYGENHIFARRESDGIEEDEPEPLGFDDFLNSLNL